MMDRLSSIRPDNGEARVRVLECMNDRAHHVGRDGWRLGGERVSVGAEQCMVALDGPASELCVANRVEILRV
jgi:hypothetical protein